MFVISSKLFGKTRNYLPLLAYSVLTYIHTVYIHVLIHIYVL